MGPIVAEGELLEAAGRLVDFEARAAVLGTVDRLPLEEARSVMDGELRLILLAYRGLLAQSLGPGGQVLYILSPSGRAFLTASEDATKGPPVAASRKGVGCA